MTRGRALVIGLVLVVLPVAALALGPEALATVAPAALPSLVGGAIGGAIGSWRINGRSLKRAGRAAARSLVQAHERLFHTNPRGSR